MEHRQLRQCLLCIMGSSNMKTREYLQVQSETSAWTRQSGGRQIAVRDSVQYFCDFVPTSATICEIGCGDGYALDLLNSFGYSSVVGCDVNISKLQIAKQHSNIVSLQDAHKLGFPNNAFDAIYCTHTLEHTHDGYTVLAELYRILRPKGIVFVIVPDHEPLYGDTFVEPEAVIPLEERSATHFEDLLQERHGFRSETVRNQFPFTMKLLTHVIFHAGFSLQYAARIDRGYPELWALASKPESGRISVDPIIQRSLTTSNKSLIKRFWKRIQRLL